MMHLQVASDLNVAPQMTQQEKAPRASTAALEELFVLLEEYGPAWYTQEHHDRAVKALLRRED